MTHTDNVLNHTLHDAEFMRFLKELKMRKKFFIWNYVITFIWTIKL